MVNRPSSFSGCEEGDMNVLFYLSAAVAIAATALTITRTVAVHALLYLVVSLLAVALVFYALGAPFVAALEVIIYAGAIMVLFLFVIMLLNLGPQPGGEAAAAGAWLAPRAWLGPAILAAVLLVELVYTLARGAGGIAGGQMIEPAQVGMALFGPYLLGVELASLLLLAGLVGAHHLGSQREAERAETQANLSPNPSPTKGGEPSSSPFPAREGGQGVRSERLL